MKCCHLFIQGDVHGVGFRSWMKREVDKLDIVGWVKNREDGVVEAIVQGDEKNVQKIVVLCKKGPEVAWVSGVEVKELAVDERLFNFQVVY